MRDLLGKLHGFGSENTRTGNTFPVTFKVKRKHSGELCRCLVEEVGSEGGKGKLFYLVFPAGAKPGGFVFIYAGSRAIWTLFQARSGKMVIFFMPCLVCWKITAPLGRTESKNCFPSLSERGPESRAKPMPSTRV